MPNAKNLWLYGNDNNLSNYGIVDPKWDDAEGTIEMVLTEISSQGMVNIEPSYKQYSFF